MRLTFNKLPLMGATAAVLLGGLASAQSDDCASATAAVLGANAFDCAGATTSAEQPDASTINNDLWFTYTASFTGDLQVDTCNDADDDTKIAVYAGTACPSGGELAYNDDNSGAGCSGFTSLLVLPVVSGNDYLIQVGGFGSSDFPAGNLNLVDVTPPPLSADDCAAPDSRVGAGSFDFDTTAATNSGAGVAGCFASSMNSDIYLEWTADFTGIASVSTCNAADYDTKLAAYSTGVCPPTTAEQLACNDDASGCSGFSSEMFLFVNSGDTYLIAIGGYGASDTGTGVITFSDASPAPTETDDCAAPLAISGLGLINVNNENATDSGADSSCGGLNKDVWLLWTADFDGDVKISTCDLADYDTKIAVYSGTAPCPPTSAEELACNDDTSGCAGFSSEVTVTVVSGESYLVGIGGFGSTSDGTAWVEFSDVTFIPPCPEDALEDNDDCLGALPAPLGLTTGLAYAGPQAPPPGEDNDFFSITIAPFETLNIDIFFLNANGDTDLFVYDADGGNCGVGYSPSTNLAFGYSASDDESISWFNDTGASVNVIFEIRGFTSVECQTYDMFVEVIDAVYSIDCLGDGSYAACPCGNESAVGDLEGCLNGTGAGATIGVSGTNVVVNDDIVFSLDQAPANEPCLLFQGASVANFPFADGIYCVGSPSWRIMPVLTTDGSGSAVTAVSIVDVGDVVAGQTRAYQWIFRDGASGGACGAALNMSPAAVVIWQ